jgi:hypothetical protein
MSFFEEVEDRMQQVADLVRPTVSSRYRVNKRKIIN